MVHPTTTSFVLLVQEEVHFPLFSLFWLSERSVLFLAVPRDNFFVSASADDARQVLLMDLNSHFGLSMIRNVGQELMVSVCVGDEEVQKIDFVPAEIGFRGGGKWMLKKLDEEFKPGPGWLESRDHWGGDYKYRVFASPEYECIVCGKHQICIEDTCCYRSFMPRNTPILHEQVEYFTFAIPPLSGRPLRPGELVSINGEQRGLGVYDGWQDEDEGLVGSDWRKAWLEGIKM
jgi:hypothetical protein